MNPTIESFYQRARALFSRHDVRLVLFFSVIGILTHAVPHQFGVSTVGAVGMVAAAYLPRRLMLIPVFLTIFVVDALGGFYALAAMSFVYLGHLLAAFVLPAVLGRISVSRVASAAVLSAFVFYLVSNLTPMAMGYYPPTLDGLVTCYVNGLPYLFKGVLANLGFGGLAFAAIHKWGLPGVARMKVSDAHRHASP